MKVGLPHRIGCAVKVCKPPAGAVFKRHGSKHSDKDAAKTRNGFLYILRQQHLLI